MATKASYITSLLAEVGRPDKVGPAGEWFDDVYQMLNNYADWKYLETKATRATVANTFVYGWPADFRTCTLLKLDTGDTNSRKLTYLGQPEFERLYPKLESVAAGYPVHWTHYNRNLIIAPKPSAVWTMEITYVFNPPSISDLDSVIFSVDFDHIFRSGMRGHGYALIREYDKAKYNFDLFFKLMEEKKKKLEVAIVKDESFLQPFGGNSKPPAEYWNDPMIRSVN
jgi:hypothetical protein